MSGGDAAKEKMYEGDAMKKNIGGRDSERGKC
jgi:hypothetical protein